MKSIFEIAAEVVARRGIDLNAQVQEPEPFDPDRFRLAQAEAVLADIIPGRFRDATTTHPVVLGWAERFLTRATGCPSLVLIGEPGTGKTYTAYAVLRAVVIAAVKAGKPVYFKAVRHPDFNDMLRPKQDGSHEHALDPYLSAELLLFDDIGAGKQSDWTADSLYRLVDHRWSEDLPTIYTTNASQGQLATAVGERIVSRLSDATMVLLNGPDRRKQIRGQR